MSVIQPKFVAIDSSMLGKWAADAYSDDIERRKQANLVMDQISSEGWVPVIGWHHFEELVRHADENVAKKRIQFLQSLPMVAWIWRADGRDDLGSVVDVQAAEIKIFLSGRDGEAENYIKSTRACLLRFGKPSDIPTLALWLDLRPNLIAMGKRQQEIASICHASSDEHDNKPLSILNNKDTMSAERSMQICLSEISSLTNELIEKGDKRLSNHEMISQDFYNEVFSHIAEVSKSNRARQEAFIEQFGFSLSDFREGVTLGEFKRESVRRTKLEISAKQLGLRIQDIWPKLRGHLLPSEEIISEIRLSRKNAPRSSGSDLNDDYLTSLIPYLDAVFVDKRTYEHLRQAKRRRPKLFSNINSYFKASFYYQLPSVLKRDIVKCCVRH